MLCNCLGDLIRIKEFKILKGVIKYTGKIFYRCNRCSLLLSEKEYQNYIKS